MSDKGWGLMLGKGAAVLNLGSEVGVVKRRLGDLNKRENYVFVFCLFDWDTIYYNLDLLVQAVRKDCRS